MHGKTCLVTGATSGIGKATVWALARLGATIVLACRNESKGRELARELRAATGNQMIDVFVADLSLQWQVRGLADELKRKHERLDVLVTGEGIKITLAVNHLAPFLLTNLLLDKLKAAGESRVVNVNSDAHEKAVIDFGDIQMRRRYPSAGVGMRAYGNAKLAHLLTTYELARRLRDSGVAVNALHPGYVATNILPLGRASGPVRLLKPFWNIAKHVILTAEQGAATPVYLASSPELRGVSGLYFEKCAPAPSSAASRDVHLQRRMWGISERLTGG
jgi:NAD(P)-dependent dehydrogenase (short-subunit alcohol dehydrogenase family)